MKKHIVFFAEIFIFSLTASFTSCVNSKNVESFTAMDTYISISSFGPHSKKANMAARARIAELENILSTTIPESDVGMMNLSDSYRITRPETEILLDFSLSMAEKTSGAFNPALLPISRAWGFTTGTYRVPSESEISSTLEKTDWRMVCVKKEGSCVVEKSPGMMLDFGAVGKGFAGDEAALVLRKNGVKSAILDLGGNIHTVGSKPDGSDWNIGLKNPWGGEPPAAVRVKDLCVVTSGGYERFFTDGNGKRYSHIFDGNTGRPVENDISGVAVISSSGLYADALSTAMFVMGLEGALDYWRRNRDFEMVVFSTEGAVFYTSGLSEKISFFADFEKTVSVD